MEVITLNTIKDALSRFRERGDARWVDEVDLETLVDGIVGGVDGLYRQEEAEQLAAALRVELANQDAISKVVVGEDEFDASDESDSIEVEAGANVQVALSGDKVTISATDTTYEVATAGSAGLMSATDKAKLDGIEAGAEVNQSAFGTVLVGEDEVEASKASDSVRIEAGDNVTLSVEGNEVEVSATDTTYRLELHGHTVSLVPSSGNPSEVTIPDDDTTYDPATTSSAGLMSATDKAKLDGIEAGATLVRGADMTPIMDGDAASGHSERYAREDHVHPTDVTRMAASLKGAANGVAELDSSGKVPSAQLPGYVDDVVEGATVSDFPATGESGKIYVATSDNSTYRWGGSTYVSISNPPDYATQSEAEAGVEATHVMTPLRTRQAIEAGVSGLSTRVGENYAELTSHESDTDIHITSAERTTWNAKASTSTATASADGLMSSADKEKLDGVETDANAYELPTMSATTRGGARVGDGLVVVSDALSVDTGTVATRAYADAACSGLRDELSQAVGDVEDAVSELADVVLAQGNRITEAERKIEATRRALLVKNSDGYYDNASVTAFLAARFDGKTYGVSVPKTTATACTKTGANAGIANPEPGWVGHPAVDPYDDLGPFQHFRAKGHVDSDGMPHVKAIRGIDSQADWDECTDNVWSMAPIIWLDYDESGTAVEVSISDTHQAGMSPLVGSYLPDGTLRPYMLTPRHVMGNEGGTPVSKPGLKPWNRDVSHNSLITQCKTATTGYSGKSFYDNLYPQLMFMLKYATKNTQSVFAGCTSYDYQYNPAVAETGVRRVILTNAQAANLVVGSSMMLGTRIGATDNNRARTQNCDIFDGAAITTVEAYDSTRKAVYFDVDEDFDVATTCLLSTSPWKAGVLDEVDGDGSVSQAGRTNGKEPFQINDVECMVGLTEVLGGVIISNDGTTGWVPYVNHDSRNEATSVTSGYTSCGTPLPTDATDSWKYGLFPSMHEGLLYATQTGGSSASGLCDGHYTNKLATTGMREWRSVGTLHNGVGAGLFCVNGINAAGTGSWDIGSRLSGTGRAAG